jgi:hypothetical protein
VADGGNRLARIEEGLHERHCLRVHTQLVGIGHSARQQQCVELVGRGRIERHVDLEVIALVEVLPALNLALHGRDDLRLRPRLIESLARLRELDLLEAVRHQNRHLLVAKHHSFLVAAAKRYSPRTRLASRDTMPELPSERAPPRRA